MKTFLVEVCLNGRVIIEVKADSEEEAMQIADIELSEVSKAIVDMDAWEDTQ
jgi:hypothetical protein